ncbi:MAG: amidase [Chloroflexi bacterium]|nr:amidase [Chloroflexota bacterium]
MNGIRFATVGELSALLRSRRVSAVELAGAACDLLEREGPKYNALAALTRDRARREALAADRAIRARTARSRLLGIPYGVKDLLSAKGAPTTWGAPPFKDQVFDEDATAVAKLRRSGATLAGKLSMVELAGGGGYRYPSASLQGPGRNPWDRERWSGGSSSGSGSAVGAGLVPFALGSETSGSIGTPSAYCGVTGLRPTYGLVSRHGAMALCWTLDKIGPMARTAEDCGIVLEAIAGPDPKDATSSGKRFRPLAPRDASRRLRGVRIGYAGEEIEQLGGATAKAALLRGVRELVRILNAKTVRAALPPDIPYGHMVGAVLAAEAGSIFAELIESDRFEELRDAKQKAGLRQGLEIKARDYLKAMRLRVSVHEAFRRIFDDCDLLLSAGRTVTATPLTQPLDLPPTAGGANAPKPVGNAALIAAGNLAGLPAIFFPCGFGTDGLPVGLQLVGPPFSEGLLVAAASAYQRETAHHSKRPKRSP